MRHFILGILVLCLTLAASVVTAQEVVECETIDENVIVEEFEASMSTVDFGISEEEMRMIEQQRRQEEMLRVFYVDVGMTKEKLEQYTNKLAERMQPYAQWVEKNMESIDVTPDNYIEMLDVLFDNFLVPVANDFRTESLNFFSEEQYAKMVTRLCQMKEQWGLNLFRDQSNKLLGTVIYDLWILSDVVGLTEEQFRSFVQVQKDFVAGVLGVQFMLKQELELIMTQLLDAQTDEERADIQKRFRKLHEKVNNVQDEFFQPLLTKVQSKLDTLLTAEQKNKLAAIKTDIPDYMRRTTISVSGVVSK